MVTHPFNNGTIFLEKKRDRLIVSDLDYKRFAFFKHAASNPQIDRSENGIINEKQKYFRSRLTRSHRIHKSYRASRRGTIMPCEIKGNMRRNYNDRQQKRNPFLSRQ